MASTIDQAAEAVVAEAAQRTFTLDAPTFIAAVDQCLVAVAKDDSRPVLTGVYMRVSGGLVTFVTADGFQLVKVEVPLSEPGGEWTALIEGARLKDALAAVRAADKSAKWAGGAVVQVTLADNLTSVTLALGESVLVLPLIQGTFPSYEQLIPICATEGGHVAFNAGMVGALLTRVSKYVDSRIVRMRVQEPSAPMRFDWKCEERYSGTAVVMPMFVTW